MDEIEDFFSKNFYLFKMPKAFGTEEGKKERKLLSCFFEKLLDFYEKYIVSQGYSIYAFSLTKPFNLLYGFYKDKLYWAYSTDNALKGRTALYRINDDVIIDTKKMSNFCAACGFSDNTLISDTSIDLYLNANNNSYDDKIDEEAKSIVEYEIKDLERKYKFMNVNPIFGEYNFSLFEEKVFMLMPFGDQAINEFYEDHIKKVINELDMICVRADDIFNNKSIIDDIWRNINESKMIIADLTNRNPNVFYEVGIAHTLGKQVILISQAESDIPFDLRHIRTIFYTNTTRGAAEFEIKLKETIKGIIQKVVINP